MALLKGFERPSEGDLNALWREGVFVLDTSVLLNLYRYRDSVRNDLLKALETVKERLWVPYHVALEYERNRIKAISQRRANIRKAREKIEGLPNTIRALLDEAEVFRRHSYVDAQPLVEKINELSSKFCEELDELKKCAPDVHHSDAVREQLERLLSGKIGVPPKTQDQIRRWDESGVARFSRRQPPGFLDQSKEDDGKELGAFVYGGLEYQRKFGDLYIWEQLKNYASGLRGKPICFVTDDQKEDWWWLINSEGQKRLGPRPELKEEIFRESNINFFHMYGPDAFLEGAKTFKSANIQPDSVTEARAVSLERVHRQAVASEATFGQKARLAVWEWVAQQGGNLASGSHKFPDFLHASPGGFVDRGYDVVAVIFASADTISQRIQRRAAHIREFFEKFPAAELRLMFVFRTESGAKLGLRLMSQIQSPAILCAGYLDQNDLGYRHIGCTVSAESSDDLLVR